VVTPAVCQHALAVMATAGGIVAVSPGKGGLGTFSPPLDRAGNSVRGQLAARHLSSTLGLSLFASGQQRPSRSAKP
jgi:glutaminase